jgi:hypothetical protein
MSDCNTTAFVTPIEISIIDNFRTFFRINYWWEYWVNYNRINRFNRFMKSGQ